MAAWNESCRIVAIDASRETRRRLGQLFGTLGAEAQFATAADVAARPEAFGGAKQSSIGLQDQRRSEPPRQVALWLLQLPDDTAPEPAAPHAGPLGATTANVIEAATQESRVRLLVLATPVQVHSASECLQAGADDVLTLPLELAGLPMRLQLHHDAALRKGRRDDRTLEALPAPHKETTRGGAARRDEEERVKALRSYVDLFVSAVDGAIAFDAAGRLLFANPAAYEFLGYEPATIPAGSPVMDLIVRPGRRQAAEIGAGFADGVFPHDVDLRARHRSGREVILNGSFSALRDTLGATLFSFREVTAARRAERQLQKTQRFLESLIDASVDAIVASDMRGKIVLFNNGAHRLYGHDPKTAVAEMYVHALYPGDGAREVGRMLRSKQHGGVGRLEPVRMETIDAAGNLVPISLTAATIYEDGRPVANFGIFCDLREQGRMERALAEAQETLALTQGQGLLAELAGATAHELNQPLTSIMGCTELIERRLPSDSPHRGLLRTVQEQVQRMAEIVRKIGDLTKYETKNYVGGQRILDIDRATRRDGGPGKAGDT